MSNSWKWQLRDRLGQWMDMDSEVRWLGRGKTHQGTVVGSSEDGMVTIKESGTGRRVSLPTSRVTAITLPSGDVPPALDAVTPTSKASAPTIPKNFSGLSNRQLEDLYWTARDHPNVSIFKWARIAREIGRRKIELDPHAGGFIPAGVFAAGTPTPVALSRRHMHVRLIERELALR